MRWNPFRRPADDEAPNSVFESTVVEDLQQGLADAVGAMPSPGEATSRAVGNIGHVGRYALKSVLGEGGLGTVYAAWDPLLSRAVAVKTLHLQVGSDRLGTPDDLILNEARAAARLSHPHIVTIHDAGPSEQGIYIAMEPLRGRDLRHLLREGWRPGAVEVAHLARRVADALAYAHGKGVIHCDIKPANIFMVGRKQPKVLDFGIARVTHRDAPAVEGPVAGSPYYLAPEQLRGDPVDRRSDVYSLGVVMFELLTGQRPYGGSTVTEISHAVLQAPPPQARSIHPKVPAGLSAIVARAMARAPNDRHASARHLAQDLRHWLDAPEAQALGEPRPPARHRLPNLAVVSAAVLAAGMTAWWQAERAPPTPVAALRPASGAVAVTAQSPILPALQVAPQQATPDLPASAGEPATAEPAPPPVMPQEVPASFDGQRMQTPPSAAASPTRPAVRPPKLRPTGAGDPSQATATKRATPHPPAATGLVRLAISPWGQVSVDGRPVGTTPPLHQLTLGAGRHTLTITNGDLPVLTRSIEVDPNQPLTVRHQFGP